MKPPTLTPLGDKIVVELIPQKLSTILHTPETADYASPVQEAVVYFKGTECKADVNINDKVLVKSFAGAPKIKFNDITLRLYNTEDVLAVFV